MAYALVERAARPSDLLVVGDRRSGHLEMDDEREVGLVVAHAERRRRDHALQLVALQQLFDLEPAFVRIIARVGPRRDAVACEPVGGAARIVDGERVDDAGAGKRRDRLREPRQPLGLRRKMQHVEREALAIERTAQHDQVVTELIDDVVDDAIVRGCRGAQHRNAARQQIEDARDPSVVGPEVVAPVADAVRLVDHEEPRARGELRQHRVAELLVGEAFGRHEQEIDPVGVDVGFDLLPVGGVVARDAGGAHRRRSPASI